MLMNSGTVPCELVSPVAPRTLTVPVPLVGASETSTLVSAKARLAATATLVALFGAIARYCRVVCGSTKLAEVHPVAAKSIALTSSLASIPSKNRYTAELPLGSWS
jgi:hypothetical protein